MGTTRSPMAKLGDAGADFDDRAGQLMAEDDGRLQHHGVIAAAVDLEVGAAGERRAHAQQQFSMARVRDGYPLHAQVFLAV